MSLVVLDADADTSGLGAPPGRDGHQVELSTNATHIRWRLVGSGYTGEWANLLALSVLLGAPGPAPIFDVEEVDTLAPGALATVSISGASPNLRLTFGIPVGSPGTNGDDGREVELRKTSTAIQWRLAGETWANVVLLSDITGSAGPAPSLATGNVTTLAPGSAATFAVRQTGTGAYAIDAGLPRGQEGTTGSLPYSARSSNTALGVADKQTLVDLTGAFTQTFAAAATLGAGWWCEIRNSSSGMIPLDPNGSETIDGAASRVMSPGETRQVVCTGTAFVTIPIDEPMKQIRPTVTIGGPVAAVTFTDLNISDAIIDARLMSHNSGSNASINLEVTTDNGATWLSLGALGAAFSASSQINYLVDAVGLAIGAARIRASASGSAVPSGVVFSTPSNEARYVGDPINGIRITASAGQLDAGTIKLFGRR